MVEQAKELLPDVARHRADLIGLQLDPDFTPERMKRCTKAVDDLESALVEILTTAWVPRDIPQLATSIVCVNKNIQRVRSDVAAALDVVLLECKPDELYRVWCAMSFAELLMFQRDVLMTALAKVKPEDKWTNLSEPNTKQNTANPQPQPPKAEERDLFADTVWPARWYE